MNKLPVAYFSMEIAVANDIKTYAGGLGVLAGDILKSASEINFPMIGISLLSSDGYFKQKIDPTGNQLASKDIDYKFTALKKLQTKINLNIGSEKVWVGVLEYLLGSTRIYFLDTNISDNNLKNRRLTAKLYEGNIKHRLKQEIILGRGGVKMLRALGYKQIRKYHLNEGHGALAAVELYLNAKTKDLNTIRNQCVFTTHTPLLKAQDVFSLNFFKQYQPDFPFELITDDEINMTKVGMFFSGYINAVSKLHQPISQKLFPNSTIKSITNGVNSETWTSPEFKKLFDQYIPNWRKASNLLKTAKIIPLAEISQAHLVDKQLLCKLAKLDEHIFTIGFARRFATYKRPEYIFQDLNKLKTIAKKFNGLQIIFAGKAHPNDLEGQNLIKQLITYQKQLIDSKVKIVLLENYNLDLAKILVAGVDLWLNTPLLFNEASGTSGMKAAHNGVPQLSTLDGWWPEGYRPGKTGWAIKGDNIYQLLATEIFTTFNQPHQWQKMMQQTIAINASYFNTERVLREYIKHAY